MSISITAIDWENSADSELACGRMEELIKSGVPISEAEEITCREIFKDYAQTPQSGHTFDVYINGELVSDLND